jgi:hypothetical protein
MLTLETAECAVRLLASCAIAVTLPREHNARSAAMFERISDRPSLGHWVAALRTHLDALSEVVPESAALIGSAAKPTRLGRFILTELTAIRNEHKGHGVHLPSDAYAALLPKLDPVTELMDGIARTFSKRLVAPDDIDWGEGDLIQYVARSLQGPLAIFPTRGALTSTRLFRKHVYLCNLYAGGHLSEEIDLNPLILYGVCPLCQREDVFHFDGRSESQIRYRSFLNGHELSLPSLGPG